MDKKAAEAMASLLDDDMMPDVNKTQEDDLEDASSMGDYDTEGIEETETETETEADEETETDDANLDDDADEGGAPEVDSAAELAALQERHNALLERLQRLEQPPQQQYQYQQQPQTQAPPQQQQSKPFELKLEPKDFLTKRELDDIMDRPELFNVGLNRMMEYIAEQLQPQVGQTFNQIAEVVGQLPAAAAESTRSQYEAMALADEFYRNNPDLQPYRRLVGMVAEEALGDLSRDPSKTPTWAEVFEETSKRVRKDLGLQNTKVTTPKKRKAALPGAKTTKGRSPKKPGPGTGEPTQQDYIKELMEVD